MQERPAQQAVFGGLRAQLGSALDSVTEDKLKRLVDGIFSMKRAQWAHCPDCRRKVRIDAPDYLSQAKAIALLADQALGRPVETVRIEGGLVLEALRLAETMPLSKLSREQLGALAEADMSDEEKRQLKEANDAAEKGDWEPLRALGYRNLKELSTEELHAIADGKATFINGHRQELPLPEDDEAA